MKLALTLVAVCSAALLAQQGGGSNPNCIEEGFDATVKGPKNCNCTSSDLPWDPTHWETYQGPIGRGEILDEGGTPVTGKLIGGGTGFTGTYSPTVTIPAGKCFQIVYDFWCCPVSAGTYCAGTGAMTMVETDADCD